MKMRINLLSGLVVAIILVGVISAATVFFSAQNYRDLAFDFQRQNMARLVEVKITGLVDMAIQDAGRLVAAIENDAGFNSAFESRNRDALAAILEAQLHQVRPYPYSDGIMGLYLFDEDLAPLARALGGDARVNGGELWCPELLDRVRMRPDSRHPKPAGALCRSDGAALLAVIVPLGGAQATGYLQVVTDPVPRFAKIGEHLDMPLQVALHDGAVIYSTPGWQAGSANASVSAEHVILADDSRPALKITSVRNADALIRQLDSTNNRLLIVVVMIILATVAFALALVKYSVFKPLKDLGFRLRDRWSGGESENPVTGVTVDEAAPVSFSELGELYETLHDMAIRDPLTGTYNRALLEDRLTQLIAEHRRSPTEAAVLLVDMVRFKYVNDLLGHQAGDFLLKEVVGRIGKVLRQSDTLARLGGDEFVILLPDTDRQQAIQVAEKIIQSMASGFEIEGHKLSAAVSIGIAMMPEHGVGSDELLANADQAMYSVKERKNAFAVYNPVSNEYSDLAKVSLDRILKADLEPEDLYLVYHPVIDFATGEVSYFEALLRWQRRDGEIMLPETFVRVAEQSGLIKQLSDWVIETACRELALMQQHTPGLRIGINLSMHNLHDLGLTNTISRSLQRHRLQPKSLLIEITETGVMLDPDQVVDVLGRMAEMGLKLSIDDFGTGHSSLVYLRRLPVHTLKVDKSFVQGMDTDEDNAAIVHATIDLAHSMGLTVTAEGVENRTVQHRLKAMGCDYYQGFYVSEPMKCKDVITWLGESKRH